MQRESFIFYQSFKSAADSMSNANRLAFYDAIIGYALTGKEPKSLKKPVQSCWDLVKPIIDSNNKKYADGSKGGRPKKTSGFDADKTTGSESSKPNEKEEDEEEDKESRKRQPPPRRTKKEPQAAVFQSPPSGPDRIGYAATEELKKRQIKRIEQAAEQTTAQPPIPKEDVETAELKKAFRESAGQEQSTAPAEQPQPPPG